MLSTLTSAIALLLIMLCCAGTTYIVQFLEIQVISVGNSRFVVNPSN